MTSELAAHGTGLLKRALFFCQLRSAILKLAYQNNNSMNFILYSENLTYHQRGEWKLQFQTKFDFTAKIQPREELKHLRKSHF